MRPQTVRDILSMVPEKDRSEMRETYFRTIKELKEIFPRGRFRMAEDGRAVLVARQQSLDECMIYSYGPGKFGVFYGRHGAFLDRIPKELILDRIACNGEGIVILRSDKTLPNYLPQFSRGKPSGRSFTKKNKEAVRGQ